MVKTSLNDVKHICIIQTAFIGDVLLSLPLVQFIKNFNPEIKISFVSTPLSAGITSCMPAINNVLTYDKRGIRKGLDGIRRMAEMIKEQNCDCIISCHRSLRTSLLVAFLRPALTIGFDNSSLSLLYSRRVKYIKPLHEIRRNLELLRAFDEFSEIDIDIPKVQFDLPYEDRMFVDSLLAQNKVDSNRLISVFPGSVWPTKRWKREYFVDLINRFKAADYQAIINGSEDESELCRSIAEDSKSTTLAGKLSLSQTMYLISISGLVITNDSAPTHMASLMNIPTMTIFGPTHPIFGFGPTADRSIAIGLNELKCRPCEIHGNKECPIGTHECMQKLMPDQVFESGIEILNYSVQSSRARSIIF